MKWYNSVKVKLLGFFITISIFFLISIIAAFITLRQEYLHNRHIHTQTFTVYDQSFKQEIGELNRALIKNSNDLFINMLIVTFLLTVLVTLIGYVALKAIFINPIQSINKQLQNALSENTLLECQDKGEIGMLVENLNTRTINLAKARARESKEHQLRMAHEEMLMQQSKMAVMGEMMDSVAHQWKQPLNALTLYSELIRNDFEEGNVDQEYIEEFRKNIQIQIDHMVNTLDEFRSFFRPNKEKRPFKMLDVVNSALFLAKDDILKNRILVKIEQEDDIEVDGYENEFKHLILNILNNAKDAFIENDVQQRLIRIRLIASQEGDSELVNKLAHLLCYLFCLDADYHRSARLHRSWIDEHRLCYCGSSQSEQRGVVGVSAKL